MDTSKANQIQAAVRKALEVVEKEHGIKIQGIRMTYRPEGTFTLKVEGGEVGTTGEAVNKEALAFTKSAPYRGFLETDLGQVFKAGGKLYKIEGLRPKAPLRSIVGSDVTTGRKFVFDTETVKMGLRMMREGKIA